MKQVFVAQHPTEAHLVQGILEANGIAAEVHGESLFGARGEAPPTPDTLPTVWVLDDGQAVKCLGGSGGLRISRRFSSQPGGVGVSGVW